MEYGNSKTTTLLPSAKCTRPLFQGRTGCGGRPSGWHDIVTCQHLVSVYDDVTLRGLDCMPECDVVGTGIWEGETDSGRRRVYNCRHAVSVRLSLCPSVRPSRSCILSKRVIVSSRHSSFSIPNVTAIFRLGPFNEASNAGGVGGNCDSEPISGFTACCRWCDRLSVINTAPLDRGKLWHLSPVLSRGVCWWRETTNVYDKKSQRYAKNNITTFDTYRW